MQFATHSSGGYKPLGGQSRLSFLSFAFASYPKLAFTGVFALFYLITILYCDSHFYRDPTSAFWDPKHGYDKSYSSYREAEAEGFIASNNANSSSPRSQTTPISHPSLCLGIATIARPKIQYIQKTVGSVLEGLTTEERNSLHFVFFIAHSDPAVHPIHGQPWTVNLPDRLLDYDRNDKPTLEKIAEWEKTGNHREKGFFDYTYLLKTCQETGAPYVAMLEGDVLAAPGWLPRALEAAQMVDAEHGLKGGVPMEALDGSPAVQSSSPPWLYIRMFWTETYLGWNSEEWPTYFFYSMLLWTGSVATLLGARIIWARSRSVLTNTAIAHITCVWLPLYIVLYFAAGRMSMQPPRPGVRRMENFGCCSQGMIFRSEQVPTIISAIEQRIEGYMDMLLETLASRDTLERWAIFPSLLQHIGGESSKGDAVADARAQMVWNFAFERYGDFIKAGRNLWKA